MKALTLISFALTTQLGWADSLLDSPVLATPTSSPSTPFKRHPRQRPVYDFRQHDTVTVNVNISDSVSFNKKMDTKRDNSWLFDVKSIFETVDEQKSFPLGELEGSAENKTKGQKSESSKIRMDIPCEIIEILPSGDLVLDGLRKVRSDENAVTVRIGGRVNPKYINPQTDVVMSERILQLDVKTIFDGPLADNEKQGWLAKILSKIKIL
jgi:flagellar basal body L-ring protein FlgH